MPDSKYFPLKLDLIHTVSQLPDEKAGLLFKHILAFVNRQQPTTEDILVNLTFEPVKVALLDYCAKKAELKLKRSHAGKVSAFVKNSQTTNLDESQQDSTNVNKRQQTSTSANTLQQDSTNFNKTKQMLEDQESVVLVDSKKKTVIDYQEIIDVFNKVCSMLSHASVTAERKRKINALLKTYTLDQIGYVFIKASQSNYLIGNKVDWKADLDWILKPVNFTRILEGTFDNYQVKKKEPSTPEEQWKEASDAVNKLYGL